MRPFNPEKPLRQQVLDDTTFVTKAIPDRDRERERERERIAEARQSVQAFLLSFLKELNNQFRSLDLSDTQLPNNQFRSLDFI